MLETPGGHVGARAIIGIIIYGAIPARKYVSPYNKRMNACYDITDNWQLYLIIAEFHWSLVGLLLRNKIHLPSV